jgi:ribose/xylose/arabinose/galactoside ABC-type transport system permease subunit
MLNNRINVSRVLVTIGVILIIIGLAWPLLQKLGLGRLPGDISIERDGFRFYFPITTSIIVSLILTLILWILRK